MTRANADCNRFMVVVAFFSNGETVLEANTVIIKNLLVRMPSREVIRGYSLISKKIVSRKKISKKIIDNLPELWHLVGERPQANAWGREKREGSMADLLQPFSPHFPKEKSLVTPGNKTLQYSRGLVGSTVFATIMSAIAALAFEPAAYGDVIFNNGPPDLQNAYHSDFSNQSPSDTVQAGDDFAFTTASIVQDVHWWGVYAGNNVPSALDNFTIRIFEMPGGTPNVAPLFQVNVGNAVRTDTGVAIFDFFDVYEYSVDIADLNLGSGQYLLSIVNETFSNDDDWYWCTSNYSDGNGWGRPGDGGAWSAIEGATETGAELAFNLTGTSVPAPGGLALLAIGAFAGRQRRRRDN